MSRDEMNLILEDGINAAVHLLEKNSEFFPFAVAMDSSGEVSHVNAFWGDEHPPSAEVITALEKVLVSDAQEGKYRATGIVSDVKVTDADTGIKQDAISVAIEHRKAEPITCLLPYELRDGQFSGGEIIAQGAESVVFMKS